MFDITITEFAENTWIQSESASYPNGAMVRKGLALFPDGKRRRVYGGIPDTYFSIPCRKTRSHGKGFLTSFDDVLTFTPYTTQ